MEPVEQINSPAVEPRGSGFRDSAVWMRGLYMLLLALAFGVAQTLLGVITSVQFLWLLFAGEANVQLTKFGSSLSRWLGDTARFLTCASDVKPFPWADWPAAD